MVKNLLVRNSRDVWLTQEEEEEEEEEQAKMKESAASQKSPSFESPVAISDAGEQARLRTLEKHEQLCELSRALAVLASASVCPRADLLCQCDSV